MFPLRYRSVVPVTLAFTLLSVGAFAQETVAATAAPGIMPLVGRWLHILGAIFLLGGAFYFWAVLRPAANAALDDEAHQKLRASIMKRWSRVLHVLILVILLSGLYNFLVITRHAHQGQPVYHMLFGIKFILAFIVFGLAEMLAGKKAISQKLQQNAGLWVGITVALGVTIVLLAGYMKMM